MKKFLALALAFLGLLSMGQAAFDDGLIHGVDAAGNGNGDTLDYLLQLRKIEQLNPRIRTRIWFDPYTGLDTNRGTYDSPYKTFQKLKEVCGSYTHCTVKGDGRAFSPLTMTMVSGAATTDDFDFVVGEAVSGTWNGGASTGTVVDWDRLSKTLVIARATGNDPISTNIITGASGAVWNVSGAPVNTIDPTGPVTVTFTDNGAGLTDTVNLVSHGFFSGQGAFRLTTSGTLPAPLTINQDYYVCGTIAANSFQLWADPSCTSVIDFSGTGTGTNQIDYEAAANLIDPNCAEEDRICVLIDSEFPDAPAKIDGNRFHTAGEVASPGGVFGATGQTSLSGGWVAVQNFECNNIANDCFTIQNGFGGKLLVLNGLSVDVRNGTENRTDSSDTNNCYTTHFGGAIVVIGDRGSKNRHDSASGSGACVALGGTAKYVMIGDSEIGADPVAANNSATLGATGADAVIYGHRIRAASSGIPAYLINPGAPPAERYKAVMANVLFHITSSASFAAAVSLTAGNAQNMDLQLYNVTGAGAGGRFLQVQNMPGTPSRRIFARGLLVDNIHYWILSFDKTACNIQLDFEGIFDNDDAGGGDGVEFLLGQNGFTTRGEAQTYCPNWKLFAKDSFDSGGPSTDGTAWIAGTDFRCKSGQNCYGASNTLNQKVTLDLENSFSSRPEETCIPEDVIGRKICQIEYRPYSYGAR